jgi:hypothetical protein
MHGFGIFIWPDNRKYIGDFQKDKRHGFGIFIWPDAKVYYGYWSNSKQQGKGIIINSASQKKLGEFKDGNRERWVIFDYQTDIAELD